ncbi:NAD(P)-binding domain-containing protein [Gracilibacillus massiliensis]|uniref:NAD(P)-binding domain-containing protein n=1 Tax=Gracilibacillus massiliensis TaxID=1564956 RepID=UPI00071C4A51|nr:NAD(P)-binding domain-containing protein [Gracilibacillus massiliensis]
MSRSFPIVIIGGGPVGMAAAAHLVKRNKSFILIEKGEQVGSSLLQWKHVRLFSPWEYTIDRTAEELLISHGWTSPPKEELPTGGDMVRDYLQPLAQLPEINHHIITEGRVIAIQRYGIDKIKTRGRETFPFEVIYQKEGEIHQVFASGVIDATGTWESPNPAGASGNVAIGEKNNQAHIYYGIPEATGQHRSRYAGKVVAVVGSGHSAINSLLELDRLKEEVPETKILWVLRKKTAKEAYGGGEDDALPARGALGTKARLLVKAGRVHVHSPFRIDGIKSKGDKLQIKGLTGHQRALIEDVDEIIVNTGARPDFSYLRELRYQADQALESVPALAELIDPNVHSCGTVRAHGEAELRQPEKNFYIVGSKSYGRAPTFLMATGYEQVRSIAAAFAGDWEASRKVELHLPETGVCGVPER